MKRIFLLGLLVVYSFPASAATLQYDFSTLIPLDPAMPTGIIWFEAASNSVRVWQVIYDPISLEGWIPYQFEGEAYNAVNWTIQVVPVPAAVCLFASALAGLGVLKRKHPGLLASLIRVQRHGSQYPDGSRPYPS